MDEPSREFGKLEARVGQLEKDNDEHKALGREFRKYKNTLIGICIVMGNVAVLLMWAINKFLVNGL